ncbi:MAG: hypothetical protein GX577_03150 [Leptolinea sp.]|nr:hypothetical protein [Leptolinea sp.]
METVKRNGSILNVGFHSSWLLAVSTTLAFALGMMAIPPAGPYCPANCMSYPFPDILQYFPRDYFWMYASIIQLCVFIVFMVANHFNTAVEKKIFSSISLSFTIITATVLMVDYFVQFSVVPISVMHGQTEGIPLLTQYNGHGVFIALEELGFTIMSLAFFFLALSISDQGRMDKVVRWILFTPLLVNIVAFIVYSVQYGLYRDYRYEVVAITINWLVSIVAGVLLSIRYRREKTIKK